MSVALNGTCKYSDICKYGPCEITGICKHFLNVNDGIPLPKGGDPSLNIARKAKKRKDGKPDLRTHKHDDAEPSHFTPAGIARARQIIANAERAEKLTPEQQAAIDSYRGKHYQFLTKVQREQIISIAKDLSHAK